MGQKWEYRQFHVVWHIFRAIGRLPDGFLYSFLGGVIYIVLYKVVRYRVKVVKVNLRNSFPEKNSAERLDIERKFYRHLASVFIDTIKLSSMSREEVQARMVYTNIGEQEARMRGQSWLTAMSHYGSWELTINYVMQSDHRLLAVYRPIHNRMLDRYYYWMRSRFGTQPVPMHDIYREVIKAHQPGQQPVAVALIADQTPPKNEIKHWFRFLNQDTPFFSGMEKMARRFHMPVFFLYLTQPKPGYYEGKMQLIYDGKQEVEEHEITQRYVERLEAMIRETPHLWMWSHRRWKHTRESVAAFHEKNRRHAAANERM